jgi:hypothetical protein
MNGGADELIEGLESPRPGPLLEAGGGNLDERDRNHHLEPSAGAQRSDA